MLKDININHEVIRITLELNKNERDLLKIIKEEPQDYITLVSDKMCGVTYPQVKDLISNGILFLDNNTNRVYLSSLGKIYVENN